MKKILLITFLVCGFLTAQSFEKNYNVVKDIKASTEKTTGYNMVQYSVLSRENEILYQIVDKVDHDIPFSKLEVFNDGSSVLINPFYGRLTFVSNSGGEVKTLKIRDDIEVEYERTIFSVVDKDLVLMLFRDLNEKHSTIQIYDRDGIIKNEFNVPITNVNGIAYSEKLNQIYVSYILWENSGDLKRNVKLLNTDGEIIKSIDANFEKGFFTEDDQFIAYSNRSLLLFDTGNLELNYFKNYKLEEVLLDATYLNKEIVAAFAKVPELINGEWYFRNPTIRRIDSNGKVIAQVEYERDVFSDYKFSILNSDLKFIAGEEEIIIK